MGSDAGPNIRMPDPDQYQRLRDLIGLLDDMAREGLLQVGPEQQKPGPKTHLSDEEVRAIYMSTEPVAVVARRFGCSRSIVKHIRTKRCHKNVTASLGPHATSRPRPRVPEEIRKLIREETSTHKEIAEKYGVHHETVQRIRPVSPRSRPYVPCK